MVTIQYYILIHYLFNTCNGKFTKGSINYIILLVLIVVILNLNYIFFILLQAFYYWIGNWLSFIYYLLCVNEIILVYHLIYWATPITLFSLILLLLQIIYCLSDISYYSIVYNYRIKLYSACFTDLRIPLITFVFKPSFIIAFILVYYLIVLSSPDI